MKIPDIFSIIRRIRKKFIQVAKRIKERKIRSAQKFLATRKGKQKKTFEILKQRLSNIYNDLKKFNIERFMTPFWKETNEKLEKEILLGMPFSFLRNSIIINAMFVTAGGKWLKKELNFLKKNFSKTKLKMLLMEDYVGNPLLLNVKYLTSHNSIHHLYHIIRFLRKTKLKLKGIKTIIEWGGGYGNLAKIFGRLAEENKTYIIIDLPLMCCIQWIYLTTILGENKVNLIQNSDEKIAVGKINLLPVCFIDKYELKGDLFVSTWALTESSKYS